MQDAVLVGVMDRLGDGPEIGRHAAGGQGLVAHQVGEVSPAHIIHRKIRLAVLFADFVDGDDVWMAQPRSGAGFGAEALHELWVGEPAEEQHLNRDNAFETHLPRPIHDPHAALGDFLEEFVVAKALGNELRIER